MTDRLRHFYRPAAGAVEVVYYTPADAALCHVERLTVEQAWARVVELTAALSDSLVGFIPRKD